MADFNPPFARGGPKRAPTSSERELGFPCGEADLELFNYLQHLLEGQIGHLAGLAGVTSTGNGDLTVLTRAIQFLIDAATGDGNTEGYLLLNQAQARLPIFPEILSANGAMTVSETAPGTIQLPDGVHFLHRGIFPVTTAQTDFATEASRIYHLRWRYNGGMQEYVLADLADNVIYNPNGLPETDPSFDSDYDDMLIARVITNSSNVATITNLVNKNRLFENRIVNGAQYQLSGKNVASAIFHHSLGWGRTPAITNLSLARIEYAQYTDNDLNIMAADVEPSNHADTKIVCDRYRLNTRVMYDGATVIKMQFSASA